ncbi:MAG: FAD binding domain-containing protein [Deltaproteobacteria bacterium]|nr:FAD binding domain-containing protein [Deltaproteobacteria bacterium]
MIPSFHRPATVTEALRLKASLGPGAMYLAGGTEVNNLRTPRPEALIDLTGLGLEAIEVTTEGCRIGARVTVQRLLEHPGIPGFLKVAARQLANRNIRNQATIGGHLGARRSCGDLIPALLAAEARVTLADREVPVEEVLAGAPDLMLSVLVPATDRSFGLAHQGRTASDVSIVTAAASLALDGGQVRRPLLAVGGVAPRVVRLREVEQALEGRPMPPVEALEALVAHAVNPIDDHRGSAAFKRHLAAVLAARSLRTAARDRSSPEGAC